MKKGSPLYKSLFLTKSTKEKKDKAEYTTKTYYVINGKKYYSVKKGKKFAGYVSEKSLTKAPAKKPAKPSKPVEKPEVKPETKPETPEQKPSQDENKKPEVTPEVKPEQKPEVKPEEKPSTPSQDEDKNEPSKEEDKTPSKDENKQPAGDKEDHKQPSKEEGNKKPAGNKDEGKKDPVKDENKQPSKGEGNKKPAGNKDEDKKPAKPSTPSKDEGKAPAKPNKNDKPAGSTSTSKPSKEEDKKDPVKDEHKQLTGNKDEHKQPSKEEDKKEPEKKPETQKPKPEVKPEQKPVAPSKPVAPKPEPKPEPTPEPVKPAPKPEQQKPVTPSKPVEENKVQSITTSGVTLNNPEKLSAKIMDSSFATSTAKKLAKIFGQVATPVWNYSTGQKGGDNLGLEITWGWSRFDGHGNGDYTKAFEMLKKYAQNVKSVSDEELNTMIDRLVEDFQGMRVITTELNSAMKVVQAKAKEAGKENDVQSLLQKANKYMDNPTLDNWKNIVTTTKQLKEKAKELQKQIDSQKTESSKVKPITTDRKILKNPAALTAKILSADSSLPGYAQAQRLARVMQYATAVWAYSTGEKVIYTDLGFELLGVASGVNSGLEVNSAWSKFDGNGNGDYYQAIKLLQDYAKNPNAVDVLMTNMNQLSNRIISELGGMRVSTVALHQAVQKAEAKLKKANNESLKKLVFEAKQIITDSYGTNRGLGNWKHIVELTKQIQEATK